jgi:SAM-dependent methyltransferase
MAALARKLANAALSGMSKFLEKIPVLRSVLPHHRIHPIDRFYNIETSGFASVESIHKDRAVSSLISPYYGSQPSVTRAALASLCDIEARSLVDIGCGKGRVVIVGSEFPFKEIMGVDLSPEMVRIAQTNIARVSARFPSRPVMRVVDGDAFAVLPKDGKLAFYLYHPFGRELVAKFVSEIEKGLAGNLKHVFIIYHNPVWGSLFDASPVLRRWAAGTVKFEASELRAALDRHDNFVVWQSVRGAYPGPRDGADRQIIVTNEKWRAELAPLIK